MINAITLTSQIWDQLRTVQDPEVHLDIVNLGLIYNIQLTKDTLNDAYTVTIDLTFTSPSCLMAPYLFQEIHSAVTLLDGIEALNLNLVWDPPWSKDKISQEGKMELGLL
jgi:metal-sulfur cluster biosynthetic enzyme